MRDPGGCFLSVGLAVGHCSGLDPEKGCRLRGCITWQAWTRTCGGGRRRSTARAARAALDPKKGCRLKHLHTMAGPGLAPAATGGGGVQSKRPGRRRLLPRALRRGGRGPGGRLAGRAQRARARRGGRRGAYRRPDQGASRAAIQSAGAGCDLLWGDFGLGLGLGLLACSMRPLRSTSLARAPG